MQFPHLDSLYAEQYLRAYDALSIRILLLTPQHPPLKLILRLFLPVLRHSIPVIVDLLHQFEVQHR